MERHRVFVDGYKSMRAVAKYAANKAGKDITIFKNGKCALEGIRKMDGMVDVVTGLMLPKMNGIELARCLKDRPKTEIFMCSNIPADMGERLDKIAEDAGIIEVIVRKRMLEALAEIGIEPNNFGLVVHDKTVIGGDELEDRDMLVFKRPVHIMTIVTALVGRGNVFFETDDERVREAVLNLLDLFDKKPVLVDNILEADTVAVVSFTNSRIVDVQEYLGDFSAREMRSMNSKKEEVEEALRY